MSLFDKRENILPYEYPELLDYMKAIQQSYWLVDEFNYDGDKQNYLADLKEIPFQKNLIKKAMLAISQIEVNVKTFWGRLDMLFPKLEISLVGSVFGDSECFTPGHELMTKEGWKKIEDIKEGDEVLQYKHGYVSDEPLFGRFRNSPKFSFTRIKQEDIIEKEIDEDIYIFADVNNNCLGKVTKNHRIALVDEDDYLCDGKLTTVFAQYFNPDHDSEFVKRQRFIKINTNDEMFKHCLKHNEVGLSDELLNRVKVSSSKERYTGKVHCVNVPSSYLVVKYEDNVFVSGNCRHFEAYKRLLEILGLNEEFTRIHEIPALQKRVEYTTKFVENKALNNEETILSVVLFSMFIEHISLFSQFLVLMSFNYYKNMFKGISNAVEATSKEEEIHGKFGIALYEILRRERPELFTEAFFNRLESMADEAFKAEMAIVDWMYESETGEDLDFLPKRVVINYIKNRYNRSYKALGLEPKYVVDQDDYKYVEWFDIEVIAIKENDFFNKRNVDYAKGTQGQTADDLF